MTTIPELWHHLTSARWFAGKGRSPRPGSSHVLDWFVRTPGMGVRSELVEVVYPDQTSETYQLLLSYRDTVLPEAHLATLSDPDAPDEGLVHVHDALADPDALRALADLLAAGGHSDDWTATVSRPADLSGPVRVFGGEQSNSSLLVGRTAIVKFFRRLEPGANLDIAVHDALGRAGVSAAARLFGWLSTHVDGDQVDLAMVTELLPQARDGWEIATAAAGQYQDFTTDAAQLGTALASVHQALRDTFPTARLQAGELSAAMRRRLAEAAAEAPGLVELVAALDERFAHLSENTVAGQRIHGDFHLGQTLLTANGWRIIDFEGEPIKSLAERREPDSPWRDVAGMLRSFAYATSACPDPTGASARDWLAACSSAFLDAYVAGTGTPLGSAERELLEAYLADKAVYEVVYETRNRPDWVSIPLGALRVLAG
ncbi:maltokinase N-terminal cap-like domain-containing protein [Aestuariimicrobium sp. Y1814]|uniref:maltokinase N-terminal cap-like domain-containing protein n=1 Tax=Aestuariimicrobium sp. Y1814 TaxID=3418742 RepID=UPI003DA774E5